MLNCYAALAFLVFGALAYFALADVNTIKPIITDKLVAPYLISAGIVQLILLTLQYLRFLNPATGLLYACGALAFCVFKAIRLEKQWTSAMHCRGCGLQGWRKCVFCPECGVRGPFVGYFELTGRCKGCGMKGEVKTSFFPSCGDGAKGVSEGGK